jgi:1,4-dihydroxy-2-naphthoate octaprenyltransferase
VTPWLLAARPATLPAAIVPVLVGTAAAFHEERALRVGPFLGALLASILIQIGTNLANDYFDFRKGADTSARLGPVRVTQAGLVAPATVLRATLLTFGLAAVVGAYLVYEGGWPILLIGLLSILSGMAYTGGPYPLGYHGLGDVFVFVFFGLVAVTGSAYLQSGRIDAVALFTSVPVGMLVTAILVVNNLRDVETDRAAGKRTLAVRLGQGATRFQYAALVLGAYLVPPLIPLIEPARGPMPLLLPWLSLPLGLALVRAVLSGLAGAPLNGVLKKTGQLHLLFGCLFAFALGAL